jgi:hypothetical protein
MLSIVLGLLFRNESLSPWSRRQQLAMHLFGVVVILFALGHSPRYNDLLHGRQQQPLAYPVLHFLAYNTGDFFWCLTATEVFFYSLFYTRVWAVTTAVLFRLSLIRTWDENGNLLHEGDYEWYALVLLTAAHFGAMVLPGIRNSARLISLIFGLVVALMFETVPGFGVTYKSTADIPFAVLGVVVAYLLLPDHVRRRRPIRAVKK